MNTSKLSGSTSNAPLQSGQDNRINRIRAVLSSFMIDLSWTIAELRHRKTKGPDTAREILDYEFLGVLPLFDKKTPSFRRRRESRSGGCNRSRIFPDRISQEVKMNLCPKCNKRELREGEKYCPSCSNRRTNVIVKVGEVVVTVLVIVGFILLLELPPRRQFQLSSFYLHSKLRVYRYFLLL